MEAGTRTYRSTLRIHNTLRRVLPPTLGRAERPRRNRSSRPADPQEITHVLQTCTSVAQGLYDTPQGTNPLPSVTPPHRTCIPDRTLQLLRAHSGLPEDLSDTVFKNISHDIFVQNADRLETWAQQLPSSSSSTEPPATPSAPQQQQTTLETLREAIELKKTNANLMKPAVIEDFINDAYAHLHRTVVPDLIARSNEEQTRGRMRVGHLVNIDEGPPAAVGTPSPGPAAAAATAKEDDATAVPTRQRVRGVGRRELQKRADALLNKPAGVAAAAVASASVKAPNNNNNKPFTPPPPPSSSLSLQQNNGGVPVTSKSSSTIQAVVVPTPDGPAEGGDGS
ncbi:MAG: hypothetical protein Q9193_003711, partial [Seirophora villosa]